MVTYDSALYNYEELLVDYDGGSTVRASGRIDLSAFIEPPRCPNPLTRIGEMDGPKPIPSISNGIGSMGSLL